MFNRSSFKVGSLFMVNLPEFSSNHKAGRSCVILGNPDKNGYVPIVPFSSNFDDWYVEGLSIFEENVGGRNEDGFLMIGHQGYAHVSRFYRELGEFDEYDLNRVYVDLESHPRRVIPRFYHAL